MTVRPSKRHLRATAVLVASALLLATTSRLSGQEVAPSTSSQDPNPETLPSPEPQTTESKEAAEETFILSPFEVTADQDRGYGATTSMAGTRLNTDLRDIPASITVITKEFLKDTGATNVNELLVYTTSTEVGGPNGNFLGDPNLVVRQPHLATRVRGLDSADLTRDLFRTDVPLDSYNIERVDISRGANSVLFGLGSPAGIVNYSLKTADLNEQAYNAEIRVDSNGGHRESVDLNFVAVPKTLAVRVAALNKDARFAQDESFDESRRAYVNARWTPKIASSIFTQIQVNFETGETEASRPSMLPPVDYFSTWWNSDKYSPPNGQNPFNWNALPNESPYLADWQSGPGGNWWDTLGVVFPDPASATVGSPGNPQAFRQRGGVDADAGGWLSPGNSYRGLTNRPDNTLHFLNDRSRYDNASLASIQAYETATGNSWLPSQWTNWGESQTLDRSVFDYIGHSLTGKNNTQYEDFQTLNLSVVQTYFQGTLGFEATLDSQRYDWGNRDLIQSDRLSLDPNLLLRDRVTPNANYGRAVVVGGNSANVNERERDGLRVTAYYMFDFEQLFGSQNRLSKILGEHTFTGMFSRQEDSHLSYSHSLFRFDDSLTPYTTDYGVIGVHYLDSPVDFPNASSPVGANLRPITAIHEPGASVSSALVPNGTTGTAADWMNTGPLGFVDWRNNLAALVNRNSSRYQEEDVDSEALVVQSRFFGGTVVGLFGIRNDAYEKRFKGAVPQGPNIAGSTDDPWSPDWAWAATSPLTAESNGQESWGVVVHTPQFIADMLPGGTSVSLGYNKGSNFRVGDVAMDPFGQQYAFPQGETEDWSVLVSTLNDKLNLRVTKYEGTSKNAVISGLPTWSIRSRLTRAMNGMMAEVWGHPNPSPRTNATPELSVNEWFFGSNYDQSIMNAPLPEGWTVESNPELLNQPLRIRAAAATTPEGSLDEAGSPLPAPIISPEEIAYRFAWFDARTNEEWGRPFDPALWNSLGLNKDKSYWGGWWPDGNPPGNMQGIGEVRTEGYEAELIYNPTPGWRISANVSRTEAVQSNIWSSIGEYIANFEAFALDGYNGSNEHQNYWRKDGFADIAAWGASDAQMLGHDWFNDVKRSYLVRAASEGRQVGELREWRANLITNYAFESGALKGFSIGGSARWQDDVTVGYRPAYDPDLRAWIDNLDAPIQGPSETNVDLWVGYRRKLGERLDWEIQLNIGNLFASDDLIAYTSNPDGTVGQYRLAPRRTFELTNRFSF